MFVHTHEWLECQTSSEVLLRSHVALSQRLVDGQQAGDVLDDDFPSQFDWTVAVVRPLSLRLKPAGFLTDRRTDRRTDERRRETAGQEETKHHLIKSGQAVKLL